MEEVAAVEAATRAADAAEDQAEQTGAALREAVRTAYAAGVRQSKLEELTGRHRNTIAGWVKDVEPPGGKRKRSSSRRGSSRG